MTDAQAHNILAQAKIGIIGSGVMGEAMIGGLLARGVVSPAQIMAADVMQSRLDYLQQQYGIHTTLSNREAAEGATILVLSIKPQMLQKVLADLHGTLQQLPQVVLSIIAGTTLQTLSEGMGNPNVVRAMPNTPARIGKGITVWTAAPHVNEHGQATVREILAAFGEEVFMDEEHYLDMATALSGTGPAYIFMFMEALIDAGVHMGFPRRIAEKLVFQTMRGSVDYAEMSGEHPAALRNQVTSPGGTTAEAVYHMEKGGLRTVVSRAVWAAYQRSIQLGAGQKVGHPAKIRNPDELDQGR